MKKAALHNLGCKVNAYETEAMQQLLEDAGYKIVPFEETADVYVINTCSVTNIADKKSRQMLHRAKKKNPNAIVVAAGCYVQAAGEELKADPAIDVIVGNNKKTDLVEIIRQYEDHQEMEKESYLINIAQTHDYEELHLDRISDHTRAFIKIQDGCNQFCTYCIIPYTRGRIRSRSLPDIVAEVSYLAAKGYREFVLTGIHLDSYGMEMPEEERVSLIQVMETLDLIPGVERMRLGSLEPRIITEEFAGRMSKLHSICPHFHLSLQSGCDAVLKRMNRRYDTAEYEKGCRILRTYFENPAITTDVIVGFPQETEEEFAITVDFLKKIHFYEMHIFKYSRRAGTKADKMTGQIPETVKGTRSDVLLKLEQEMSREYRESFLGKELEVLMEEKIVVDGIEYLIGHTREYVRCVIPYEESQKGRLYTGIAEYMLTDDIIKLK